MTTFSICLIHPRHIPVETQLTVRTRLHDDNAASHSFSLAAPEHPRTLLAETVDAITASTVDRIGTRAIRTVVTHRGVPGCWDASQPAATLLVCCRQGGVWGGCHHRHRVITTAESLPPAPPHHRLVRVAATCTRTSPLHTTPPLPSFSSGRQFVPAGRCRVSAWPLFLPKPSPFVRSLPFRCRGKELPQPRPLPATMLSERQKEVVVRKANEEIDLPFVSYVGRQILGSSSSGARWPVHVRGMVVCAPALFERARCALPIAVRDHGSHACALCLLVSFVPSYPSIALCCFFLCSPAYMLCIVLAHLTRHSALQGATRVSRHRKGGGAS